MKIETKILICNQISIICDVIYRIIVIILLLLILSSCAGTNLKVKETKTKVNIIHYRSGRLLMPTIESNDEILIGLKGEITIFVLDADDREKIKNGKEKYDGTAY